MKNTVIIIGSGPAGLSLACSLAHTNLNIIIIEKLSKKVISNPLIDGRDIALTHRSKDILKKLNIWDKLPEKEISEIAEAKVLNGHSSYALHFGEQHPLQNPMGFLISNHHIRRELFNEVKTFSNIKFICNVSATTIDTNAEKCSITLSNGEHLSAALIVGADSRFSETRRNMSISASMHDFGRTVIVCKMQHEKSHDKTAYECFHYGGTLAVLPLSEKKSSIVITVPTNKANEITSLNEEQFNINIQRQFWNRYGRMNLIGERYPYPLVGVYSNKFVTTRFALIGDAAVGMHPVTAHGFNLGLQGQDYLASQIKSAFSKNQDIGSQEVLIPYQKEHRKVSLPLYLGTNTIVKLFTNESILSKLTRKVTLRLANNSSLIKNKIMAKLTEKETTLGNNSELTNIIAH